MSLSTPDAPGNATDRWAPAIADATRLAALPATGWPAGVIVEEAQWRAASDAAALEGGVTVTRWRRFDTRAFEVAADTPADRHVIAIALRAASCRLSVSGRVVQDGAVAAGMVHISAPETSVRCVFRGPCDVVHLHVPNALIAACAGAPGARLRAGAAWRRVAALPAWRLKRAVDYIEAQLAEPLSLAATAASTGITRMHFAAQFKQATGLRPHEYVLRRRVERAQALLVRNHLPLVEVALAVGFQTQAHFTTVFKRMVGRPPHAWRRSHGYGDLSPATAQGE